MKTMLELEIVNVVATADLRQQVDLVDISQLPYTIFDQEIYGGRVAYLKTPAMHGKVTIFPSGKLISVGSKSPEQAQQDLDATVNALASSGLIEAVEAIANLRNIVAVQNLEKLLDLEGLALLTYGIYEPEQFPGMILRRDEPKVTYLIFASGKVVIAGSRSIEDLRDASENIKKIIEDNDP